MTVQGMERANLPIVIVRLCFGDKREYMGRLANKEDFKRYRETCGFRPEDIVCEVWPQPFESVATTIA